jgi:hypothetical protein
MLNLLTEIEEQVVEFMQKLSQCDAMAANEKIEIAEAVRKDLLKQVDSLRTINLALENIQKTRELIRRERSK